MKTCLACRISLGHSVVVVVVVAATVVLCSQFYVFECNNKTQSE